MESVNEFIAYYSKEHFLDRYNREIVLEGLRENLQKTGAYYLDAGCGAGYLLEEAEMRYPNLKFMGCESQISQSEKHSTRIVARDIVKTDFLDGSFDAISCLNVLEHLPDDIRCLKELYRILKRGGKIVVTVPAGPNLYDFVDELHGHFRRYTAGRLKAAMESVGFKVERSGHFGAIVYPAFYVRKKWNQWTSLFMSSEQKVQKMIAMTKASSRIPFMETICRLEWRMGKWVGWPFGVRCFVVGVK